MATPSDETALISPDNGNEDSFEFVDEEVEYVKGIVCADFVPLNSDGIVLQKGAEEVGERRCLYVNTELPLL